MKCKIENVLTPAAFFVIKKEDESTIRKVEFLIEDEVRSGSVRHGLIDDTVEYVAVDDKGGFRRGRICERRNSSCNVFLIDHGRSIDVENSNLYPLPKAVIEDLKPLAFKICLFGVFPITSVEMPDGEIKKRITDTWPGETKSQIVKYFKENPDVVLEDMEKVGGVTYCNIFIDSKENGLISLRMFLQNKYDAFFHAAEFRRRVMESDALTESSSTTNCSAVSDSSGGAPLTSSKVEKWKEKNEETRSSSGSCDSPNQDAKKSRAEIMKQLLKLRKLAKESKSSENDDSVSGSGSNLSEREKTSKIRLSPTKFRQAYFSDSDSDKKDRCEVANLDDLNNANNKKLDDSDDLLDHQMPITATVKSTERKSIFEELLKEDRSKVKPSPSFNFVPAGKLRKNLEKPKLERSQSNHLRHSSNRSGGSGNSDKERSGFRETAHEIRSPSGEGSVNSEREQSRYKETAYEVRPSRGGGSVNSDKERSGIRKSSYEVRSPRSEGNVSSEKEESRYRKTAYEVRSPTGGSVSSEREQFEVRSPKKPGIKESAYEVRSPKNGESISIEREQFEVRSPRKSGIRESAHEVRSPRNGENVSNDREQFEVRSPRDSGIKESAYVRSPRGGGSVNSEREQSRFTRTSSDVQSSRAASLRNIPIRKILSSITPSSSVCEFSLGNKPGTLETVKLNNDYLLSDGVVRESISSSQAFTKPLVLCSDVEVIPENRFLDLKILPDIKANLKARNITDLRNFQKWAIPAISRLSNTVIISAGGGKTLSYVVPLIDFVQDKTNFAELPDGNGPYVVIICSSSRKVHKIYDCCNMLLGNDGRRGRNRSKVQVQYAYGGGAEKEKWVDLTNGCQILISTPHCLVRLLEHFVITNFERLSCLVVDEADILFQEPYKSQVETILRTANAGAKNRPYQKILCGRKWTPEISGFVKTIEKNHVLIFGTHLEASVYAKLRPHLWLVFKEDKPKALVEKLADKFGQEKILIISEDKTEIKQLGKILCKECGITPLIADDDTLAMDMKRISSTWKNSNRCTLLCIDRVLHELKIDDAETLIHYSLPYKSKTNFGNRFSSLMKNYQRYYANSKAEDKSNVKELKVYIWVDDENHYQLPHIVEYAQRLGSKIKDNIIKTSEKIKINIELEKGKLPICTKMLEFGKCAKQQDCTQRHAFDKAIDAPQYLPTSGLIAFSVLTVHDACRFSARILEHIDSVTNKKTSFHNDYLKISMKLDKFYKKEENNRPHGLPKLGDVCAILDEVSNVFHRAQIIEYAKVDEHNQPLEVYVRLMDRGDVLKKMNRELYEISEELAMFRPQAVDIILCGLLPIDFDTHWGVPAVQLSEELLLRKETTEYEKWIGRIVLSLNNILCLDPIHFSEYLPELGTQISQFSLKDKLLDKDKKYAVPNKDHLKRLYELCENADIVVPKYELSKPAEITVKPEWAFFHQNVVKCRFLCADTTGQIFLQNEKFKDLLWNLESDCKKEAERIIRRKDHLDFEVAPGKFCLVRNSSNGYISYNRARIEKPDGEEMLKVYFVDYGDFKKFEDFEQDDIIPIPDKLMTQLPFQAIECSLIGMEHAENPSDPLLDAIYDFSHEGADSLYANVVNNDLKPRLTGGRKYEINLLTAQGVSLNKLLIEKNLVTPIDSEKSHAEDIEIENSDKEDDDEEEEELDWDVIAAEREKRKKELNVEESKLNNNNNAADEMNRSTGSEDSEFDSKAFKGFTNEELEQMFDEDEEANLFFQSFATEYLGAEKAEEIFKTKNETESKEVPDESRIKSAVQKPPKKNFAKYLINFRRKVEPKKVQQGPPKVMLPEGIFTPEVNWIQNHSELGMRIMLIDVKDYRFEIGPNSLLFCCNLDGKLYALELRLFGTINPQMTEIFVKTFYVEVILKKLYPDFWPRLVLDKSKQPNIHFDVDRVPESNKNYVEELMNEVKEKMSKGLEIKKKKIHNKVEPVDWPDSDAEDEGDYQEEENQDPHDFLAD